MCSIHQAMEEIIARCTFIHLFIKEFLQAGSLDFRCSCSKDDRLAFLDIHLEISWHIEVFIRSITSLLLLRVFHPTIPIWAEFKLVLLGELHIEIRITCIHTGLDAMIYLRIITRCGSILMSKLTDTAESQKRTETKGCSRMAVYQGIANQNAILIMLEYNFLFQDNTTYAIKGSWHFITIKLTNVLVAHRTVVVALVLVQAEVKLCSMLNYRNIQRTQEHMILIVQFWNRHDK